MSEFVGRVYVDKMVGLQPGEVVVAAKAGKTYRAIWKKREKDESAYEIEACVEMGSPWKHLTWAETEDKMWASIMRFATGN